MVISFFKHERNTNFTSYLLCRRVNEANKYILLTSNAYEKEKEKYWVKEIK